MLRTPPPEPRSRSPSRTTQPALPPRSSPPSPTTQPRLCRATPRPAATRTARTTRQQRHPSPTPGECRPPGRSDERLCETLEGVLFGDVPRNRELAGKDHASSLEHGLLAGGQSAGLLAERKVPHDFGDLIHIAG